MTRDSKRRRRRAEALARNRNWELTRKWDAVPFPCLDVDPTNGDPEMVRTVQEIACGFDLRTENCRQGVPEMYFKLMMAYGVAGCQELFRELLSVHAQSDAELENRVFHQVAGTLHAPGKWLFEQLPARYKVGSLMRHFFYVAFDGKPSLRGFSLWRRLSHQAEPFICHPAEHSLN